MGRMKDAMMDYENRQENDQEYLEDCDADDTVYWWQYYDEHQADKDEAAWLIARDEMEFSLWEREDYDRGTDGYERLLSYDNEEFLWGNT